MREVWRSIKGFEELYEISNYGRLKSFKSDKEGYILSNKNSKGDYLSVVLTNKKTKKKRYARMHRLVAEAFIPNPECLPQVNHKDGNKQNNHWDNLEWCTCKENIHHAIKHNPNILKGMNEYNRFVRPKKILQYSLDGKLIAKYNNSTEASQATGVCARNILQVANKEEYKPGLIRKQAGGFVWRFKEEVVRYVEGFSNRV